MKIMINRLYVFVFVMYALLNSAHIMAYLPPLIHIPPTPPQVILCAQKYLYESPQERLTNTADPSVLHEHFRQYIMHEKKKYINISEYVDGPFYNCYSQDLLLDKGKILLLGETYYLTLKTGKLYRNLPTNIKANESWIQLPIPSGAMLVKSTNNIWTVTSPGGLYTAVCTLKRSLPFIVSYKTTHANCESLHTNIMMFCTNHLLHKNVLTDEEFTNMVFGITEDTQPFDINSFDNVFHYIIDALSTLQMYKNIFDKNNTMLQKEIDALLFQTQRILQTLLRPQPVVLDEALRYVHPAFIKNPLPKVFTKPKPLTPQSTAKYHVAQSPLPFPNPIDAISQTAAGWVTNQTKNSMATAVSTAHTASTVHN